MQISEARRRLSALVERIARAGAPVGIGRYGRERALLISTDEYARLKSSASTAKRRLSVEGTLRLTCSPQELVAESRRLGQLWLAEPESRPRNTHPRRRKKQTR